MTDHALRIVLLGPPGSGKGTQSLRLKEIYGLSHISSGDVLRGEVARASDLGKRIKSFMDKGEIGPVELITEAILGFLERDENRRGFILDGFPRTLYQAEKLASRFTLDGVFFINVSEEEIVKRITGRRTCGECGAIYHTSFSPPAIEGLCDRCGGKLSQRSDDTSQIALNRIRVYNDETRPLVAYYEAQGILHRMDGELPQREIVRKIREILDLRD